MEKNLALKSPRLYFPWLSFIAIALTCIALAFGNISEESLNVTESVIAIIHLERGYWIAILVFILFIDIYGTLRRNKKLKTDYLHMRSELELAWKQKAKQQDRANTFSGQKDKLKSFISDKLLEFMEYDEKFVHFKGIAAEVRHNGVISYDKVTTALEKAIEQQGFLEMYESKDTELEQNISAQTLESLAIYQNARDAMEYLWALLDLSTADNMALHIGKQLIECEEHFFQLNLDAEKKMEITQSIPISPTFPPQLSLLLTISLQSDEIEIRNLISLSRINHQVFQEDFKFENERFKLSISPTAELLGNPNHIILLLENLIKNALFFIKRNQQKQVTDKVIIQLKEDNSKANFFIYNRGPNIAAEDFENIFNLGFSTRRNRKHNGKGLGLFFSKQIVDGYQGLIEANNVTGNQSILELKIEFNDENSKIYLFKANEYESEINLSINNAEETFKHFEIECDSSIRLLTLSVLNSDLSEQSAKDERLSQESQPEKSQSGDRAIENIDLRTTSQIVLTQEALSQSNSHTVVLEDLNTIPLWKVKISTDKKSSNRHRISIAPLRISGVSFTVEIATADSLLEA